MSPTSTSSDVGRGIESLGARILEISCPAGWNRTPLGANHSSGKALRRRLPTAATSRRHLEAGRLDRDRLDALNCWPQRRCAADRRHSCTQARLPVDLSYSPGNNAVLPAITSGGALTNSGARGGYVSQQHRRPPRSIANIRWISDGRENRRWRRALRVGSRRLGAHRRRCFPDICSRVSRGSRCATRRRCASPLAGRNSTGRFLGVRPGRGQ